MLADFYIQFQLEVEVEVVVLKSSDGQHDERSDSHFPSFLSGEHHLHITILKAGKLNIKLSSIE